MQGSFYRLADKSLRLGDSPGPESWLRPFETHGSRQLYKQWEMCEAHGLSIFASKADLDEFRKFTPSLRKKSVARVDITEADGVLLSKPVPHGESHHDWWTEPYGLVPESTVIEEGQ